MIPPPAGQVGEADLSEAATIESLLERAHLHGSPAASLRQVVG